MKAYPRKVTKWKQNGLPIEREFVMKDRKGILRILKEMEIERKTKL